MNRTDLTAYETKTLHEATLQIRKHSLAVGAFVTRYGREEVLAEAAELYLSLLEALTNDLEIRTGALEYWNAFAASRANLRQVSQAAQLQGQFLEMVLTNALADRKVAA
jgi:hypothetical protein